MAGFVGGPRGGAPPPRTPENSRKFAKKFLKKIANMQYFCLFCKKIQNSALNFRAFERKTQLVAEILRKFSDFLMKIQ